VKGKISALTYHQIFAELTSAYPDYTAIYNDGLFVQGLTGCAFLYEQQVFKYHLHSFISMYTAEVYASY
jgi:hypothetical protein